MKKIICLLGIPGSGKSTLGKSIYENLEYPFYEEKFDQISSISKERESSASNFEKCIGFLNLRYHQMEKAQDSISELIFVDTCFEMTEIYSKFLLKEEECPEFKNTCSIINTFIPKPDLYLNLTGDIEVILKRAKERNLGLSLENTYLNKEVLQTTADNIKNFLMNKNFLDVDITQVDLRDNQEMTSLINKIKDKLV